MSHISLSVCFFNRILKFPFPLFFSIESILLVMTEGKIIIHIKGPPLQKTGKQFMCSKYLMMSLRNYLALRFLILSLLTFFDGFTGNIT